MVYRTIHKTRHLYQGPVSQCLNELRLTPCTLDRQKVRESEIVVEPQPRELERRRDYFGNLVTSFTILQSHDKLTVTATSVVEVEPPPTWPREAVVLPWEHARDLLLNQADDVSLRASEFVFDSPYIAASSQLAEYAVSTFTPGRPLLDAVAELSHRIHAEFRYEPKSTSIDMPLLDVLKNRRGVCQDFAHVMIGALRSLRLAARYVSGYLRSGSQYLGSEASHAWVSVFVPGSGWFDIDPTNDVTPTVGHVTLALGRDYGDVTPVKGVTLGGGGQLVEVEVHVTPVE